MRKWVALLLLWGFACPAFAAKTVTVSQLEALLATLRDKPDGRVAEKLDDVALTERVSLARFTRWKTEFPGKRSNEALTRLADMSAFLDPPQADVVPNPRPDIQTQKQMLWKSVHTVANTTTRLPNMYATRETTHFENPPAEQEMFPSRTGGTSTMTGTIRDQTFAVETASDFMAMHSTGVYSRTVTYRDGHEVLDEDPAQLKKDHELALGLTTSGEFGPILGLVIGDVLTSHVSWLRWEQGTTAPVAEFRYTVPKSNAHYKIGITRNGNAEQLTPAYHGEIQIDPETGEILRLSMVADPEPPHAAMRAAIVVEYSLVTIGDRSYTCPVRGVAFSKVPIANAGAATDDSASQMKAELNDITFTDFHMLRADLRIVTNDTATPTNAQVGTIVAEASSVVAPGAAPVPAPSQPAATPPSSPASATESTPASVAGPIPVPSPPAVSTENPAPTPHPIPAAESNPATPPAPTPAITDALATGTVLHANTRLVLVDVVVTDHDRPVRALDRSRFHVFENGREQPIASFDESAPATSKTIANPPSLPPNTFTNVPAYPETSTMNVLLLDALNTPLDAQDQVRRQMIEYLSTVRPGTSLAIFTLSSRLRMAAGFTTDVARLASLLKQQKGNPHALDGVGPGRNSDLSATLLQQASQLNNNSDPGTLWLVQQIVQFAADMKTYDTDQRVGMTLEALTQLAQYLAAVPGRKNLIWFSGSFPIALWPEANLRTQYRDLRDYSDDLKRTGELLASARVAVYPVDARGVMTAPTADSSYIAPPAGVGSSSTRRAVENDNKAFFVESSQDRSTMVSIAAETGGHAYSTGNDLKAAVEKILADDSVYYALSYVPPPRDDTRKGSDFHRVEVKVDGGKYQLAYRSGYYGDDAARPPRAASGDTSAIAEATVLGAPPATQILFQARVLPEGDPQLKNTPLDSSPTDPAPASLKGAPHRYIVDLSVDPKDLTFTQEADGKRRTQLECALVAYDGEGQKVNSVGRGFTFNLPPDQYQRLQTAGQSLPVRLALDLPSGDSVLRIVVYGSDSARTGSLEIPVHVNAK
jgi:VWFA-related protein